MYLDRSTSQIIQGRLSIINNTAVSSRKETVKYFMRDMGS